MTNSADPDQLASSEANWSGSTLFADWACRVQQEKGYNILKKCNWITVYAVRLMKPLIPDYQEGSFRFCLAKMYEGTLSHV